MIVLAYAIIVVSMLIAVAIMLINAADTILGCLPARRPAPVPAQPVELDAYEEIARWLPLDVRREIEAGPCVRGLPHRWDVRSSVRSPGRTITAEACSRVGCGKARIV